ncbi:MAG: UDP-N-acetylmuramoyl-tripeptide--D-alanyl-D-alanine ligase [Bacteroidia bacterium]|nr:UDP-N-acetylmuramoyl-tripeptide--D-alanyl-D-alanine ligase [Bacteroidia bacterium]
MKIHKPNLHEAFRISRSVCTDTRKVKPGDMFFALKGPNFNGNAFAEKALETGAAWVVVDEAEFHHPDDSRYFLVEDVLLALQNLARDFRRDFSIPVFAITGSNGKTTTKELIASVLRTGKRVHVTQGNLNNHIGVPLTLLSMPDDTEIAIIEMGANKPGDIAELAHIAEPTHGMITNIGRAHLEQFLSIEGVRKTKGELFDFIRKSGGIAFVNEADPMILSMDMGFAQSATFGTPASDFYIQKADYGDFLTQLEIIYPGSNQPLQLKSVLIGEHNARNILAAVAVAHSFGIRGKNIQKGISEYRPTNNRTQMAQIGGMNFLLDAYNANPSSMEATIASVFGKDRGKVALILGDMLELGEKGQEIHQELIRFCNQYPVAQLVGVGPLMEMALPESKHAHQWFPDTPAALPAIKSLLAGMDFVLLKGSRGIALEGLLKAWED